MGWEVVELGTVVDNLNARRVPLKQADRSRRDGPYPYYGASGIIDYIDDYIFAGEHLLIAEDGANLLSRATPIAFRAAGQFWVNNHAHILSFNGKADLQFLERYLDTVDLKPYVTGSAQPKLNRANLDRIQIPLPPLPEQKRIAGILDAADALRARRREALAQLDTLLQSTFLDMFGDPVTNPKGWESIPESGSAFGEIKDLAMISDVIDCKHRTPVYTDDGYPVVRPRNVREAGLSFDECVRTTESEYADLTDGRTPKKGDIVYSRNATFGVASLVKGDVKFAIGQDVCLIVPREVNSAFLHYLLNSHFVRRQLGLATSGSTFKRINLSSIRKLKVLIPPRQTQDMFESFSESVEQQKARMESHLDELDTLFASLQSRAFNGEL
jgi:type I restriction enzyme S subunit